MILHLALFHWKAEVTAADVEKLCEELANFRPKVDCILDYQFGPDLGLRPGNADFGVAALLESPAQLPDYLDCPAHKELVSQVIAPMTESRTALQLEVRGAIPGPEKTD